jgi:hypothetical protein
VTVPGAQNKSCQNALEHCIAHKSCAAINSCHGNFLRDVSSYVAFMATPGLHRSVAD